MSRPAAPARLFVFAPTKSNDWPCKVKSTFRHHQFYIVHTDGGRRIERPTGFGLIEEVAAQKALLTYLMEIQGEVLEPEPLITDILAKYIVGKVGESRDTRSTESNLKMLVRHLTGVRLSQLTRARLQQYVKDRQADAKSAGRPIGTGAIRRDIEMLQAALNFSLPDDEVESRPRYKLWKPNAPAGRERWLTHSEVAQLIRLARGDWELIAFILLSVHTCARREAAMTLRWAPSDQGGHVEMVRGTIDFRPLHWVQSKKKHVQIPLPTCLRWLMRSLRKRHPAEVVGGAVNLRKRFEALVKKSGIEPITQHGLCHTGISWQMQRGVDVWKLSHFVGRSRKMLEERYGHLHPEGMKEVARGR
jgi:integrase